MTRFTRQSLRLGLVGVLGGLATPCASNPPPDSAVYVVRRPPPRRVDDGDAPGGSPARKSQQAPAGALAGAAPV